MVLLHGHVDRRRPHLELRRLDGPRTGRERRRLPVGERRVHPRPHRIEADVADDDQHDVVRPVPSVEEIEDACAIERGDRLAPADHRPAVGVVLEREAEEIGVTARDRHVLRAFPLLEHDVQLARELVGVERRVAKRVGENVEAGREVSAREDEVVDGVIRGGERVDESARRLHLRRDLSDTATRGAFEQHVLVHVRDAGFRVVLVGGADFHPRLQRDDGREMILTHDDLHAVREREALGARRTGSAGVSCDDDGTHAVGFP